MEIESHSRFFVPIPNLSDSNYLLLSVMISSKGESNVKSNTRVATILLDGNNNTCGVLYFREKLVEELIMDGVVIVVLFAITIWCFNYVRKSK